MNQIHVPPTSTRSLRSDAFIQKIGIQLAFDFLCFALLVPLPVIVLDKSLFGSHTEKALRVALLYFTLDFTYT